MQRLAEIEISPDELAAARAGDVGARRALFDRVAPATLGASVSSDSQARADQIVELATREPDGILRALERAFAGVTTGTRL